MQLNLSGRSLVLSKNFLAVLSFCISSTANAQSDCIKIGTRISDLDSAYIQKLSVQKFTDHEVWQNGDCYIAVVNGKITSYNNQKKCFTICNALAGEKSKAEIEKWILKTLSEFGTGELLRRIGDDDEPSVITQKFQRIWFNEHYLVMNYEEGYRSQHTGSMFYRPKSVFIPVEGINAISGGSQYIVWVKKNYEIIETDLNDKREEKTDRFYLYIDERGEKELYIKLMKAFRDLKKFYSKPPKEKDLY